MAYLASSYPNSGSIAYNSDPPNKLQAFEGNCTWYAFGRANEKLGIVLSNQFIGHAATWWNETDYPKGSTPAANSLAIWGGGTYGHVAFVEEVNGDNVVFTDANYVTTTYPKGDGQIHGPDALTAAKMSAKAPGDFKGYVYLGGVTGKPSLQTQPAHTAPTVVPRVLPVLLVHGYDASGSDWIPKWISKDTTKVHTGSGWVVYKEESGIFDSAPVYSLNYRGYMDAKGGLRRNAGILSKAIDVVTKDSGAADVYIIAHSQGGLMTRAVMEGLAVDPGTASHPKDGSVIPYKNNIFGFMTIDTPHKGTSTNPAFFVASNGSFDMINDSPFMKELNTVPTSIDEATFCSVVVGNAEGDAHGDALFSADEQTPKAGTVPASTEIKKFPVVHGNGNTQKGKYTTALNSPEVKDWAIERYRQALKKYQVPDQTLGSSASTVLAIDHSPSMKEQWDNTTKLEGAKSAASTLVNMLQSAALVNKSSVSIGLVQFDEQVDALLSPTQNYASVRDAIASVAAGGGTDLIRPIEEGVRQLESAAGGVLILLTDGKDEHGHSDDSIVEAADRARAKGITIFTIGFGTPGKDINEDLLKRVAGDDSRYSFADPRSLVDLAGSLLYSQIAAVEQMFLKSQGSVQQGQTVDAGEFDVANSAGDLQALLYWPGSTLEMKLTDPSGAEVTSGYPGLTITRTLAPAQYFISNPKPGHWKMSVYGADTSMDDEPYYALVSFKESTATAAPTPSPAETVATPVTATVESVPSEPPPSLLALIVSAARRNSRTLIIGAGVIAILALVFYSVAAIKNRFFGESRERD